MIAPFKLHKMEESKGRVYMVISVDSQDFEEIKTDTPNVKGEIRIDDNRRISAEQRKKAYATIRDIAEYLGDHPEFMKEFLKYDFMLKSGIEYFSLSDCNKTTAREYISNLIEFALIHSVPLKDFAIDRTDDIGRYLYMTLKHEKCCVCGQDGFIDTYEDKDICLCGKHSEERNLNASAFDKKYKVYMI